MQIAKLLLLVFTIATIHQDTLPGSIAPPNQRNRNHITSLIDDKVGLYTLKAHLSIADFPLFASQKKSDHFFQEVHLDRTEQQA